MTDPIRDMMYQLARENTRLRQVIVKASEYPFIPLNLHNYLIDELNQIQDHQNGTTEDRSTSKTRLLRQR